MSAPRRPQSKRRTSAQYLPERHLRLSCEPCGKHSYASKAHAKDERRRLRQNDDTGQPLDIYRCPENDSQWHIAHNHLRAQHIAEYYNMLGVHE